MQVCVTSISARKQLGSPAGLPSSSYMLRTVRKGTCADLKALHKQVLPDPSKAVPQIFVDVDQRDVPPIHDAAQMRHGPLQRCHRPEVLRLLLYLRVRNISQVSKIAR